MREDVAKLRHEAKDGGTEAYLEYLIDLLKNAQVKPVTASQGYDMIIVPDVRLLEEIAYLKAEDDIDMDVMDGLPEHMKEYQREEIEALRIQN